MTEMTRHNGCRRVVITGMGALSPAGNGVSALWDALVAKRNCIRPLTRFDCEAFDMKIAGEIPEYDGVSLGLTKKEAHRFARFVQYAIIASDEAMAQAGFGTANDSGTATDSGTTTDPDTTTNSATANNSSATADNSASLAACDGAIEDRTRFGCMFGSGIGGLEAFEQGSVTLHEKGPKRVIPLFIPTVIANMAAGNLSIRYGLQGESTCIVTACASGTHSIGEAYRAIRHGYLDVALAGGTEEGVTPLSIAGFGNLGALARSNDPDEASMPFDRRRSGFVPSEGAAAVVVESLDHALSRGAHIIAEIVGFGSSCDAYHMTAPHPEGEGIYRAMCAALEESGMSIQDIGHINAHGTSTPQNDKTEAAAISRLCGANSVVPVTSIKGAIGHSLGAAGALEAVICALSVAEGVVPPTIGFAESDPECAVNVVSETVRNKPQKVALSNSLGFGGHNATLAISPYVG